MDMDISYLKNFKEKDCFGDFGTSGNIILKCSSNQQDVRMRSVFIWLRTGNIGGLLLTW
jgi:hypothetical protein